MRHKNKHNTVAHGQGRKVSTEDDPGMAQRLELLGITFNLSVIKMLTDSGRNVDNMHEEIDNFSKELGPTCFFKNTNASSENSKTGKESIRNVQGKYQSRHSDLLPDVRREASSL